jgi:hypothetical protein
MFNSTAERVGEEGQAVVPEFLQVWIHLMKAPAQKVLRALISILGRSSKKKPRPFINLLRTGNLHNERLMDA